MEIGIGITGRTFNNLRNVHSNTTVARIIDLKKLLCKANYEISKVGLLLNVKKRVRWWKHLPFDRNIMTNLGKIFKYKDIPVTTKAHISRLWFHSVTSGCRCWIVKKRTKKNDASKLWCWRKLLMIPWTERENIQYYMN